MQSRDLFKRILGNMLHAVDRSIKEGLFPSDGIQNFCLYDERTLNADLV
jgi:hypothetical protein